MSLREADRYGYTWEEHEGLKLRSGPHYLAMKAAMKIAGRLSKGIEIGWAKGFDSGMSLDYVYENIPQGTSRLGRLIDANYLGSIGWRGIRQRKENLESALRRLIEEMHQAGRGPHPGHRGGTARYVLETMRDCQKYR